MGTKRQRNTLAHGALSYYDGGDDGDGDGIVMMRMRKRRRTTGTRTRTKTRTRTRMRMRTRTRTRKMVTKRQRKALAHGALSVYDPSREIPDCAVVQSVS